MPEPLHDRLDPRPVLSRVRSFEGRVWDVVTEEVDLEEADLVAGEWHLLLDHYASPGGSSESLRVFLARDLHDVPEDDRHQRDAEELGMPMRRVPLDEVVEAALAGDVHNGTLMIAVLAASRLRDRGWAGLRSVDEPWPTRSRGRSAADPGSSAG